MAFGLLELYIHSTKKKHPPEVIFVGGVMLLSALGIVFEQDPRGRQVI